MSGDTQVSSGAELRTRTTSTEPWHDEELQARADAHERARLARHRRQSLVFVAIAAMVMLVGAGAAGHQLGWWSLPASSTATPTSCPTRHVQAPAQVQLRVLNSTNRSGLASSTATKLRQRGYVVSSIGNTTIQPAPGTPALILFGDTGIEEARAVAAQITGAQTRNDSRNDADVDLILGQAFEDIRTREQAAGYLARNAALPERCANYS